MLGEAEAIAGSRWFTLAAMIVAAFFLFTGEKGQKQGKRQKQQKQKEESGRDEKIRMSDRRRQTKRSVDVKRTVRITVGILIYVLFAGMGYMNINILHEQEQYASRLNGCSGTISGTIYEIKETENRQQVFIKIVDARGMSGEEWTGFHENMKLLVYVEKGITLYPGQEAVFAGRFEQPEHAGNPGAFDAYRYYRSQGIFLILSDAELQKTGKQYSHIRAGLRKLRKRISDVIGNLYGEEDASVIRAMLLGERQGMDGDVKRMYQLNGIAHILAISALHIAIIGMTLYRRMRKWGVSYWSAGIGCSILVILYGQMTGLAGSTMRAIIMMGLLLFGKAIGRSVDLLTSTGIAGVWMSVINPYVVLDAGFQLSFAAITGIAVIVPVLQRVFSKRGSADLINKLGAGTVLQHIFGAGEKIRQSLTVSMATFLATLPVIVYYYYQFPLYGILLNLIVVPCVSVVLTGGIGTVICGCMSLQAAGWLTIPVKGILWLYEMLCQGMEQLPGACINIGHIPVKLVVGYYIALLISLYFMTRMRADRGNRTEGKQTQKIVKKSKWQVRRNQAVEEKCDQQTIKERKHRKIRYGIAEIFVVLIFCIYARSVLDHSFTVAFLDVGQGDGILIRTEQGTNIMIDCGSSDNKKVGEYVLLPALRYYGMAELDYVFITHGDKDHISGLQELYELEHTGIRIRNLVVAEYGDRERLLELINQAEQHGTEVLYMDAGSIFSEPEAGASGIFRIACIYPGESDVHTDANEASLVLQASVGSFRLLFTGDAGETAEQQMTETGRLDAVDVLKTGHHGSRYATSESFLQYIKPQYAVISCGKKNRYGHPHKETLERLQAAGAEVYRTDSSGAVILQIRAGKIMLHGYGG